MDTLSGPGSGIDRFSRLIVFFPVITRELFSVIVMFARGDEIARV